MRLMRRIGLLTLLRCISRLSGILALYEQIGIGFGGILQDRGWEHWIGIFGTEFCVGLFSGIWDRGIALDIGGGLHCMVSIGVLTRCWLYCNQRMSPLHQNIWRVVKRALSNMVRPAMPAPLALLGTCIWQL